MYTIYAAAEKESGCAAFVIQIWHNTPSWADPEVEGGGRGLDPTPMENHKWQYVSLKILVRTHLEKQLDPLGPTATRGTCRSVRPSGKIN